MKLHLNLSLRRALLAAMAAVSTLSTAWAGIMHPDATIQTYTDFGQNRGRYVVGNKVNALLSHIRTTEGGITIPYTDTETPYIISNTQGMISFTGTDDHGYGTMVGPTYMATVLHNGSLNGSFSERTVGSAHAINYEAIDIRGSVVFRLAPDNWGGGQYDYMLQRQSKIVTDVAWNPLTSISSEQIDALDGSLLYHSGSGTKYVWDDSKRDSDHLAGAYSYIIGTINTISNGQTHEGSTEEGGTNFSLHINPDLYSGGGANDAYPLPLGAKGGDSGSPTFIFNQSTGQYEYIAAVQSASYATNNTYGQARGNVEWTAKAMERFNEKVDMSGTATVYLNAITTAGDTISDTVGDTEYKTTLYTGTATDADGKVLATYTGVQSGTNTWKDLSGRKDKANWYAFQNTTPKDILGRYQIISDLNVSDADLFFTENLVFTPSQASNSIILKDTVDLGIGYAEFNKGADMEKAVFTITAEQGAGTMFNHAGYVVNEGAEVHLKLNNSASHMTEWRKIGAGDLYIDGTGDTNALLNVGGSGRTYLRQSGGHAAYNVLASSGATVIVNDTSQIKRDFTFGAGGGTLELNGIEMEWYTTGGETRDDSFTINALTEEALITNSAGNAKLTYLQGSNTTFAGSFSDSATSKLDIIYAGGGTWTLNSIRTNLTQSTFTIQNGKVILSGTNTIHGLGSATGRNTTRYTNADDWHYADATIFNIEIEKGATFELGSHARLISDIWGKEGSTFILREGVRHQYEYVEGGATAENTDKYAKYYGLQDGCIVMLDAGSTMQVAYSEGTTANTTLGATLYGSGAISVNTGLSGGTLTLSGNNASLKGTKTLIAGGLIATSANALGNTATNKWKVQEKGWIASTAETGADLLVRLDTSSTGVLALSEDTTSAINVKESGHNGLYIGAMQGKEIDYGTSDTALAPNSDGNWLLGGGGGKLNVHFLLTGNNNLIIGNAYSSGTVHLTNTKNDFTGTISILGTGNILTYENGALGGARVALNYGNAIALHGENELGILAEGVKGTLAAVSSTDLNLTGHNVTLGAAGDLTYSGTLTVGDSYRFGGSGNLTLNTGLNGAKPMEIDGQGNSGSSVTFARENAYTGSIVAGGGLHLAENSSEGNNSRGSIGIHAGHANALAAAASVQLQKGATLYTDGHAHMTVQNLSAQEGAAITNNGELATSLELRVTDGQTTAIENGVLNNASSGISIIKTGKGELSMGANSSWTGGLTIKEGKVITSINSEGNGVGAAGSSIVVEKGSTLRLNMAGGTGESLGDGVISQVVTGTGTIEISSGKSVIFSQQKTGFEGTVKILDKTRLYLGDMKGEYNNLAALNSATIDVENLSQVRITNSLSNMSDAAVVVSSDFFIDGDGFAGTDFKTSTNAVPQAGTDFNRGALSIDCGAVVTGNVNLRNNATIASYSHNPQKQIATDAGYPYSTAVGYGVIEQLGGTIRGQIHGEGKTLTIAGNEGMTITADSANTYGDLVIDNDGNGNNSDKFALRLDGGKAVSQTSTALGTGSVSLGNQLILRLAGTGIENNAHVKYTYANAISAGEGATLQSHNITNRLTGTVTMTGSILNLATAGGGVLELAGGLSGKGTVSVAANSRVLLGSATTTMALARTSAPQFSGAIEAGSGADITLATASVVSEDTTFSGTGSLTLHLGSTADYTLGGISVAEEEGSTSQLNLFFDFTGEVSAADDSTWASLTSTGGISAGGVSIGIDLNMFETVTKGEYILINGVGEETYTMAEGSNSRFSLSTTGGNLVLSIAADSRLVWDPADAAGQVWDTSSANWFSEALGGNTTFTTGADVILSAQGVDADNSPTARESISLASDIQAGRIMARNASYEITGAHKLSGSALLIGEGADVKLSTGTAEFSDGVEVHGAALTVAGTAMTASISATNQSGVTLDSASLTGNISISGDSTLSISAGSVTGGVTLVQSTATIGNGSAITGNVEVRATSLNIDQSSVTGNITFHDDMATASLTRLNLTGEIETADGARIITMEKNITAGNYTQSTLSYSTGAEGNRLELHSGHLTLDGQVSLDTLTIDAGQTATVWNQSSESGAEKVLDTVVLGAGSTFQTYDGAAVTAATHLGTVQLNGVSATIQDQHNAGYYSIGALQLGTGVNSSTLNLQKNAASSYSTVFELGSPDSAAGNFAGTINLVEENKGSKRSAFIILSNAAIAENAVIALADAKSADAHIGLGIHVDKATIGGLTSIKNDATQAKLFSGTIGTQQGWCTGDTSAPGTVSDAVRTLSINTAEGTDAHFYGEVLDSLNLVKTGSGTQGFHGASEHFNGSITVQGGKLTIGADAVGLLNRTTALSIESGTLDLSGFTFDATGGIAIRSDTTFSFSENAVLQFGALQQGSTYSIFDLTTGGMLDGWESLTSANFIVNGVNLGDQGRADLQLGMDGSFYFNIDNLDLTWAGGSTGTWNHTSKDWQTSDSTAASFVNNDSVTFNRSTTLSMEDKVTVGTMKVAGNATVTLTPEQASGLSAADVQLGAGATLVIDRLAEGTQGDVTFNSVNGAEATLVLRSKGQMTLGDANLNNLQFSLHSAGSTNPIGTLDVTGTVNVNNKLSIGWGTLNIGPDAELTTKVFNASTDGKSAASVININGGALTVTGTDDDASGDTDFILAFWHDGSAVLNLNSGSLTAEKTSILMGYDSPGTLNLHGGSATLKGIRFRDTTADIDTLNLGTATSGTAVVTIGETGIIGMQSNDVVKLGEGTLKASADFSITGECNVSLIGTQNGTKVDTNGKNITVNTVLTGSGKLVKEGTGNLIFTAANTYTGDTTINAGKVVLNQTSGTTYTLAGNVTGAGTLEVADGTTLAVNNQTISANLELAAGAALTYNTGAQGGYGESVRGQNKLQGNITINKDATFSFTGNAYDSLSNSATGKSITVDGGTLDFGSTRHGMGSWQLNLSNGASLIADGNGGGSYDVNGTRYAALDINQSGQNTINATSGDNTISAKTRLRGGSTINYNVAENASLNVSGLVHADGRKTQTTPASGGGIVKQGAGVLHLNNSDDELDSISVTGGTANIHGAADYTLAQLHAATRVEVGFYAGTTLDTTTQSCVSVSGSALLGGGATLNTSLTLNEGATLDMTDLGNGAVTLNGALTFNGKITMGEHLLNIVNEMSGWQELELFTGLSGGVNLPSVTEAAVVNGDVLASEVFSNVNNTDVYVRYHVAGNVGSLMVVYIPEPTTSTLSLLALSALAARRRRKA